MVRHFRGDSAYGDGVDTEGCSSCAVLRAENAALAESVAVLTRRVEALERERSTDSKTSSKPPSTDRPGRGRRSPRQRSERDPGGQPGHVGATRRQIESPAFTVDHAPAACGRCGAHLAGAEVVSVEKRQVIEVPPVEPVVVEHRIEHRRCACGHVTQAEAPAGVNAPVQYGERVRAAVLKLSGRHRMPVAQIAELLSWMWGARPSPGTVQAVLDRAGEDLVPFLAQVADHLAAAQACGFDETSFRIDGDRQWVHAAIDTDAVLLTVHPERGLAAMAAAGVLPRFTGIAVHDGWGPYRHYTQATHAQCNAHILRSLHAVTELDQQPWAADLSRLLVEIHRSTQRGRTLGADAFHPDLLAAYRARYDNLVQHGDKANPPPTGAEKNSPARRLVNRLLTEPDDILRFATDWRAPFDNNAAERQMRGIALHRKISGGARSEHGAATFCGLSSYLATVPLHGQDLFETLRQLATGTPWMLPHPRAT
jgi:transposase